MSVLTDAADADGRDYITPQDVGGLLTQYPERVEVIRLAVLEVLGYNIGYGAEDLGLCAWLAWRGKDVGDEADEDT